MLYIRFLNHFAAISYGAPVLANLVLLPCQQICHVKYRRALWGEHQTCLQSIRIAPNQVSSFS
ncbi:unnamed protein product [Protopolystoma xenopodis]|uniref:RPAP1/MINIYO-like TPR repeats domain-containing protein n=1 Tax=Protopolystoma xenopodis TaxID=117903 RepID=A0A3S5B8J9_9PLAT|nr:unnamed protein product [Protopolystoma xenopodis]